MLTRAFQLTIVTGSFACQLAFFNTATRYFFSMGREGVLPSATRTHAPDAPQPVRREHARRRALRRWSSPGSCCTTRARGGALLKLGTWVPMMGNMGILSIMALVSLAIIYYFATTAKDGQHWFKTVLAPILAAAVMFGAVSSC